MSIVGEVLLTIVAVPVRALLALIGLGIALWIVGVIVSPLIALFTWDYREMIEIVMGPFDLIRDVQRGGCYECGKYSVHKKDDRGWYVLCPDCFKARPAKLEQIATQGLLTAEDWRWLDYQTRDIK